MVLNSVDILGLRGFRSKQSAVLAVPTGAAGSGLTVVTGPNNSGKSTILEALRYAAAHDRPPSFSQGARNSEQVAVDITYRFQDGRTGSVKTKASGGSETESDLPKDFAPYFVPSRRYFQPLFGKASATDRDSYSKGYAGDNPRLLNPGGFEGRLFSAEANRAEFDKLLQSLIPGLRNWVIELSESGQYFIQVDIFGKRHSTGGVGDGIVSIFMIAVAIFDSVAGDLIVIDEPELSLHPAFQKRVCSMLLNYSSDRQIVVATHSAYFVPPQLIENGGRIIRAWDRSGEIELFCIGEPGSIALKSLMALVRPNRANPHIFGLDAREVFFLEDNVVVLEGQEDVILWQELERQCGVEIGGSLYGWGAGGASNIQHVCSLLQALGFRNVVGVVDGNRAGDLIALKEKFAGYIFLDLPADDIRTKPATAARGEVHGVLDLDGHIRPELAELTRGKLKKIETYLTNRTPA